MELQGNWSYPTSMRFGAGRITELGEACKASGIVRPLLVTDKGLVDLDVAKRVIDIMDEAGFGRAVFSDFESNPTERSLDSAMAQYRDGKHDGVVALGGGSALDFGKLIAFMAGQTRPLWDFEDVGDWWTRANADGIDPVVAVPTTAGTGSEVGRASVITNTQTKQKKIIFHPKMLPVQVIADAELTAGMPPAITAGTGMDAFAHCLEAYCSPFYHPMSQGIALEGMRLVKDYLPKAYDNGNDLEARAHMMSAAAMGATAFQKGLGAIHAISHPVGAIYNTHHGTTNAVVMPNVLTFNRKAIEGKIEAAARYLDIDGGFDGFHKLVVGLNTRFSIPENLTALGVTNPDMDVLVDAAVNDPTAGGNPIPMTPENTRTLLETCI